MQPVPTRYRFQRRLHTLSLAILGLLCLSNVNAFDQLTTAQSLIYDTGHLGNTTENQHISYRYESSDANDSTLIDHATLNVSKVLDEGRRDVELTFLSEDRNLPLPPFTGYRGNPVIIAMLEHVSQSMGADTGGGALYFRNRIRDALANEKLDVEEGSTLFHDKNIETKSLTFSPFLDDTLLDRSSVYRHAEFSIRFSDQVPAGVLDIIVQAQSDDQNFIRSLRLE